MEKDKATHIARRFIELPQDKRRLLWQKMVEEGVTPAQLPILARERVHNGALPVSFAQQRQWFLWQLSPDSSAYHVSGGLRMRGRVNRDALRASFEAMVARHETLRTRFIEDASGRVEQWIDTHSTLDWRDASISDFDDTARAFASEAFDLREGPLLRVALFSASDDDHLLVLSMHHIVSDGWSVQVLLDELVAHYRGEASKLAPLPVQYADYAAWQRDWLDAGERDRQLAYWRATLGDEHPVLTLPTDSPRPAQAAYHAERYRVTLPASLADAVRTHAKQHAATPFMVLLTAFHALLYRYTGQQTVRTGVPVANRHRVETEGLIGFFVNTQVLQSRIEASTSAHELLTSVREATLGAQAHQDLPFDVLIDALRPERSLSHTPLFQVMFNHQRRDWRVLQRLPELEIEPYALPAEMAQFELLLDTREESDGSMSLELSYARELFDADTIKRMASHYQAMLAGVIRDETLISEVPLLSEDEFDQLESWSRNTQRYAHSEPVFKAFERHASRYPDDIALLFGDETLTYAKLNARANALAYTLIEKGVKVESRVGIAAERSIELVVALLAVMKAGAAYVPLDPSYPADRLAAMQEDSGIELVLSQKAAKAENDRNPNIELNGANLAYVIFTSGSTGRPKGVGNRHDALFNRLTWMQQAYPLQRGETVLQKTPYSFDVSIWEFFWPLMVGARLAIAAPGAHRDPLQLSEAIIKHDVSTLHFVPSMLQAFIESEHALACKGTLRRIICSGEALPADLQRKVIERLPEVELHNLYGPTEAAIDVTSWRCRDDGLAVPIGAPIADTQTWVLDERMEPVPRGVAGELYLGGAGLARGYLGKPALTAERFVADPFKHDGSRLYRTGDLVRWRKDGVLDYLGRLDHQVKIRGFRIELGEIEAQLAQLDVVREAVVIAREGKLIAYVTSNKSLDTQALKAQLAQALPDYMVPWRIVTLDAMPLNANGKVDRKALPMPSTETDATQWQAPQGELETRLAAIWSELLGIERIGRQDNFFELGGDSILSLQIVARARQAGWIVSARQVFEQQAIAQLAAAARPVEPTATLASNEERDLHEPFGLHPIQAWFFDQSMPSRHHWNQSVLLESASQPNVDHLEAAMQALISHHESLRLRFDSDMQQRYARKQSVRALSVMHAIHAHDIEAVCAEAQRSLNIHEGPLVHAVVMPISDGTWRLFIVIHHLAVDAVSWRILLADLQLACAQLAAGAAIALPSRTASYRTLASALRNQAYDAELDYWRSVNAVGATLPSTSHNTQKAQASARLNRDATRTLLQDANSAYRTQINDMLLVAVARTLCRFTNTDALRIDVEGHGRDARVDDIDLSRTVGWFTSLYPVALSPLGDASDAIKRIKETLRAVPNAGLGYGMLRYLGTEEQRATLSHADKTDVVFNYLGQFNSTLSADSIWRRASESSGESQDERATPAHALEILAQVMDGEFSMTLLHRRGDRFDAATLERLARDIESELHALLTHCTSGARGITPSDVPLAALDQTALDALTLDAANIADIYPLAPMQTGIVFHSLLGTHANAYVNQLRVDIEGLDTTRFITGWKAVIAHHEVLRTGFIHHDDAIRQWVARDCTADIIEQTTDALNTFAQAQIDQGFDLEKPPLMRVALLETGDAKHHLIWTFHHALLDGWSMAQVLADVLRHYHFGTFDTKPRRFRDYIEWLEARASNKDEAEARWRALLAPLDGPTHLAASITHSSDDESHGEYSIALDAQRTEHLTAFAKRQHVTLNTLIQSTWLLLLQRYTHAQTVTFGATVAGRPEAFEGIERMVGLFINTIPVVATPKPSMSVAQWLDSVQQQAIESREYEHVALYDIQRWAGIEGGQALFDSILVFENYPLDDTLRSSAEHGLSFSNLAAREQTSYPLTVSITQRADARIDFSYARNAFDAASIERIARHLSNLLDELARDPSRLLADVSMLDATELAQLRSMSGRDTSSLDTKPVHERIASMAAQYPHECALIANDTSITYAELDRRANRVANALRAKGIGAESRVGIALKRSVDMIVALLGVLKSDAAYVPLDPSYPAERLAYMQQDSGVQMTITSIDGDNDTDPRITIHSAQLAYVIYTSGSTGQPKGVAVSHAALAQHTHAMIDLMRLRRDDRVLQFSTFSFDAFVDQLFPALCVGATVVLRDETLWDSARFLHEVRTQRITIADLTTAYWNALALDFANDPHTRDALKRLRRVQVGGEAMYGDGVRAWQSAGLGHIELANMYGPSEATVTATTFDCARLNDHAARVPIGAPLEGRHIAVLDAYLAPVPIGVAGELYIGGELLARGYIRKPGMSAERFIPDPFASRPGARMYRTGDVVRWNAHGELEYVGRVDHQVKVRGYRVEPGEIEARLLRMSEVREAAVVAYESMNTARLAAYVTLVAHTRVESSALRARLAAELPDYMVPATLTVLDAMPLNPAGKLDRHRLPDDHTHDEARSFEQPEGALEAALAQAWRDVLHASRVSRHDTFFALGGDSLAAMQVQAALRRVQIEGPLPALMSNRPLREVALELRHSADATDMLDLINAL